MHVGGYVLESEAYNGTYIPPLIETTPGATINIDLADELPVGPTNRMMAGHTNLHTHGLLVSPQNDTNDFGAGDNILIDLQKGGAFSYHIPIPTALATGILDNPAPIRHPDGLYWYHPHLHGMAKEQVSGGMSGVISIGRGKDLLVVNGANGQQDEPATISLKQHTDVKYLELKDIQMTTAVAPEQATGSAPGIWNADSDPGFCGNVDLTNLTNLPNGYCQQIQGTGAAASRQLWLFTINGQRYPRISIGAGRNHLWRIANLSATVTYLIELVDHENPVSFEVMGVDGVVAGNSAAQGGSVAGLKATRLLLMPAGRAEILIRNDGSNPGPDRDLVLRTRGLNTGPDGDTWPPIKMAEVHFARTSAGSSVSARSMLPGSSTNTPLSVSSAAATAPHVPQGCTRSVLKPGEWRRITLDQDPSTQPNMQFYIASEIANAEGPSSDVIPNTSFPMKPVDWENDKHVCVTLGATEIWEIGNKAKELHNFHLHQTKFRLARPEELEKLGLPGTPVTDPTNVLMNLGVDMAKESLHGATVWHDTLPVPLADNNGHVGKIFIVINFKATEQLGRYVFHCHILEHEDKGMMAAIEVMRAVKQ